MSDVTSSFSPASAVAAPALRKRFFEAHRFLSRAAQFPLVLAKLYRDGIDHPQFFSTLGELLPLDRLCFCIWDESEPSEPAWLWSWEANNPPMTEQQAIPAEVIQLLRKKPLRINEFEQELGEEVAVQGAPLWGGATRSMVTIPLHQAGAFLGFALFCANQAATYNDGEMAHAQLLGDALAPMLRLRLMKDSQLEQQQSELRTLELEREVTEGKLGDLQKKLGMIEAESNLLEERAETLEREKFEAQKRLQTAIGEKNRLLAQLQAAKEERDALRLVCASYEETAHHVLEDAEQIRQHLLHTHRSASMLRQLAEQRLQDSTQRSMAQTELVLDASSQMIPEALNSLNHLNSLQDLSFGELNSRQQRFVRFSLRSVKYISQLLSELNDYNRCLLGKLPLNPEPIVFANVFADVQVKFQPHIKQKRLKVDVSVDSPGAVMADSYIAQQAVYTLMEHAVDATPISGTIAISASSNDDSVVLALEHDSELELLKDDLEQLFIPFQRPDFDPDDDIPPGLALPLARELISFHHGEINVVQKGQRLCFTIEWPKELTPEQQEEAASSVSFSPLISLPPLAEEWETPLVSRYDFPALPPAMPSSDFLPASSSQSGLPSASSSNLPQPPSSLSSPSLPALPPLPSNALQSVASAPSEQDAFLEESDEEQFEIEVISESLDDLPPPPLTPPPLPKKANIPTLPYFSEDGGALEAELDLEDNSPTQLAYHIEDLRGPDEVEQHVISMDDDGGEEFVFEELEDVEELEDIEDVYVTAESEDDLLVAEPEFMVPDESAELGGEGPPHLLYMSESAETPQPSLFSLLDSWGLGFKEAADTTELIEELKRQTPTVLSLLSQKDSASAKKAMERILLTFRPFLVPMLVVHESPDEESEVQLHWSGMSSVPQKERFWLEWLDRIRHPLNKQPKRVLTIGLDQHKTDTQKLLGFCCGQDTELIHEDNPAMGVQRLYESPPDLLLIQLDEPLEHWGPLFEEVGRSARTREIPIVLFSHKAPEGHLLKTLQPLHTVLLIES